MFVLFYSFYSRISGLLGLASTHGTDRHFVEVKGSVAGQAFVISSASSVSAAAVKLGFTGKALKMPVFCFISYSAVGQIIVLVLQFCC